MTEPARMGRYGNCKNCARPKRKGRATCVICGWWANVKAGKRPKPRLPAAPPAPDGAVGSQPWGVLPAKPPGKNRQPPEK